jgi:SAM-dependent methyltransferase
MWDGRSFTCASRMRRSSEVYLVPRRKEVMDRTAFYQMLCCPKCKGNLTLKNDESALSCGSCAFVFPIVDSIPVLFPCNVAVEMKQLFTRYWDSEDKAHLYDTNVEGADSIFGVYNHESEIYGLTYYFDQSKLDLLLDAGCGNGRFLETLPPTTVSVGIDASLNLLRAARRKQRGNFHVCCELEHLPFQSGLFGTVISCRVLQHLKQQEQAVQELCRVTREHGDLILELYNTWNLKTIYKEIRMSRFRTVLNAPFTLLFRSLSPFDHWRLDYDNYNHWFEVKGWLKKSHMHRIRGRGVGFGFHKYLFDVFFINSIFEKRTPELLRRYYAACARFEKRFGATIPLRYVMEKIVLKSTKAGSEPHPRVVRKVIERVEDAIRTAPFANRTAYEELAREQRRNGLLLKDNTFHITEAVAWLKRAQDATPDEGVSRGYSVAWNRYFGSKGWQPSYPETTGYIIPTMFDCADYLGDADLRRRALAMADWEIEVQMSNGAVMGGTVNPRPSPAIFNTGQVMLGWLRAYDETRQQKYVEACKRAAAFLVGVQNSDGGWLRGNSQYANAATTTYNARVGWALILAGQQLQDRTYVEAGKRNIGFSIAQQLPNGWFQYNCLTDPSAPLLHTVCYAIEGVIGAAEALKSDDYFASAKLAADALLNCIREDGSVAGRFDASWREMVGWSCLTGDAQLAGIWLRMFAKTKNHTYLRAARRVLTFLKSTQNCTAADPGLRGGIKGSHPFDGDYGRFEVLNWATKFYLDALLLDEQLGRGVRPLST